MRIALLHLSDMHFKEDSVDLNSKVPSILKIITCNEVEAVVVVVTGDISSSGKKEQFSAAFCFLDDLKKQIALQVNKPTDIILIPGNHDCDHDGGSAMVRQTIIDKLKQDRGSLALVDLVGECHKVQNDFSDLVSECHKEFSGQILFNDPLLNIYQLTIEHLTVHFYCFNSAWMSEKQEKPGTLLYPLAAITDRISDCKASFSISMLHHPFNWYAPSFAREFRTYIESFSDLIFTGHEHVPSSSEKNNFKGNNNLLFEGGVLRSESGSGESSFNVVIIDGSSKSFLPATYKWNGSTYIAESEISWQQLHNSLTASNGKCKIAPLFYDSFLNSMDAGFSHPQRAKLLLDDMWIYPDLRTMSLGSLDNKILNSVAITPASSPKTVISGAEKAGKTALCKALYIDFFNQGFVPIYLNGREVKSPNLNEFNKMVDGCLAKQYIFAEKVSFDAIENSRRILIIDDYDLMRLNNKNKAKLIAGINKNYDKVFLCTNEFFKIEEMILDGADNVDLFKGYNQYELLPFGHLLRSKLINKWNELGKETEISEEALLRENDQLKQTVDTIIGKCFVPAFPIFLLTILQSHETNQSHDLHASSASRYYEILITCSLGRQFKKAGEIDAIINYVAELAFYFFTLKKKEILDADLRQFSRGYYEKYCVDLGFESTNKILIASGMLSETGQVITFKYKYIFYFFIAKHLANNMSDSAIRHVIADMCKKLHHEEYANIVMFLTHHSKDPFVLEQIFSNAQSSFCETKLLTLDDDIQKVNDLIDAVPKFIIGDIDIKRFREEQLALQDEVSQLPENESSLSSDVDDVTQLDTLGKLNNAFKTLDTLGQILKNYYGSLTGDFKYKVAQEAYHLGLRSLNTIFSVIRAIHGEFHMVGIMFSFPQWNRMRVR